MAGRVAFSAGLCALIVIVLVHESCSAEDGHLCAPSSCGDIHNISYPFRLQDHPQNCGHPNYTLSCEKNQTVLHLFAGKYYVRQINYQNYTIRVVDSGIDEVSIPRHFLNRKNFSDWVPYTTNETLSKGVVFVMCENPVNSPFYLKTSTCFRNIGEYSSKMYRYVKVGRTNAEDVEDSCQVDRMFLTSLPRDDDRHVSCSDVRNELVYGFELSWRPNESARDGFVLGGDDCYINEANRLEMVHCSGIIGE
ncbi:LEAF RUST 10 DISEASE-RESISTANCE LOCUS RECEPTOR-LIKE PROTEIN KINASE-like 1.2 [Corylus avellana]|uniref:LEAF RUST 10 DISEASE-RESISTANCE LOCUS RECEPTOR-LIKE PROTEIN KINASE-like 1.2 n=1 Tax=Corylus avellana TaxID=13451 RepID=UPI00286C8869|nr:LEAF RUST 10 DISEASE-RESISTANCE LOCUS RECEPTOR-LIKE PROTEIN KINASE-like 1.2 [Corylus avellana]XP_059445463.1 LEAF RUST 10 DISEASE-RESISTANCE LOCUS RECEPTOR-LIKE PROTEIN KINASE-like 1.2 [Corylus avellana]